MKSFKLEVSKKVEKNGKGEYEKQGEVEIFYPLLSELGFNAELETAKDKDGKVILTSDGKNAEKYDEDGFPVYKDEKAQYVFDAVLSAVKAQARNKLVSQTATLKPGLTIATTIEELLESGNKGDALAANREFLAAFKAWLPNSKKSEKVQAAVLDLARNRAGLSLQPDDKKQKFLVYIKDFAITLTEAQGARFQRSLEALEEACTAGDALDDM